MKRRFGMGFSIVLGLAACADQPTGPTAPPSAQIQFIAENRTADTLIVSWWWKDVGSADVPGDPLILPPNAGWSQCITFTAVAWAQLEGAQGSHDRNSSLGDWRMQMVTLDPVRPSFWIVRASAPGAQPSVSEQPGPVC